MSIRIPGTRTALAVAYGTANRWFGLAEGDPGSTTTPANEISGGNPAYARQQCTWGGANPNVGGPMTFDADGVVVTYVIVATAATVGAANQADNCACGTVTLNGQGTIVLTPTYTQT